jgi:hypothetical protein
MAYLRQSKVSTSSAAQQDLKNGIVLLFTTAEEKKPGYRRGILDTVCYPAEHRIRYSYRRKHIQDDLCKSGALRNRNALVVFVDVDEQGQPTYFPLRRVRIVDIEPPMMDGKPDDPEQRFIFSISLGEFVAYDSSRDSQQWHPFVATFDDKRGFKDKTPSYFVIPAKDDFSGRTRPCLAAWESLVKFLSESHKLRDAVFLSVGHPYEGHPGKSQVPLKEYKAYGPTYHVRPGKVYKLDLALYERPDATRRTQLKLSSSSETLEVNPPFQSVVSGLAQQTAIIACKRTIGETIAVLSVGLREPTKEAINTPNPVFLLRIAIWWPILVGFLLLVGLGSFLLSVDKDVVREAFPWTLPAVTALLSKALGSVFLVGAAHLAFRKLPSGGP